MTAQLIENMSNDDYHDHKAVSRSMLMELKKSPKKFHYKYLSGRYEKEDTMPLKIGSAFHTLILEPELFTEKAAIMPDYLKKPSITQINAKNHSDSTLLQIEQWDKFHEENEGKAHLKKDDVEKLREMAAAIRKEPATQKLIGQKGLIEPSIFWTDEETGVQVKVRIDFLTLDYRYTMDVKSTADCDEEKFSRSIINYGYDVQAFMQQEAVFQLTGERPDATIFLCCEKDDPYDTGFYMADDTVLRRGELWYRELLKRLAACRVNDVWPSQGGGKIRPIGIPAWEIKRLEEIGTS